MNRFFKCTLILLVCGGCLFGCKKKEEKRDYSSWQQEQTVEVKEQQGVVSFSSGRVVEKNNYPIVVSIPNDKTARPQSNLNKADVITEVYAEGSVTRFLALFSDNMPNKVGPVRSGRIYMVDIVDDWNGAFIHFGGSTGGSVDLNSKVKKSKIEYRLDGMTKNSYIKRDTSKKAPNNAYVNLEDYSLNEIKDQPTLKGPLKFNEKANYQSYTNVSEIKIPYNSENVVKYIYDADGNKYNRYIGDKKFIDKIDSSQVAPTNIIIQTVKQTSFNDKSGHINLYMTGSGKAVYYIGGKMIEGKWERQSSRSSTKYMDNDGNEIEFLPGQTFIQVINSSVKVTSK